MIKKGSLTKLKVWQRTKQTILDKMDRNKITPEKADGLLKFIKLTLRTV